ncbi:MAG: hypothetical protein HGGPFJEG_02590 [Ignavibacteria bacterium]|nr:hypothetical protein [Ignavibacteria bacterium]
MKKLIHKLKLLSLIIFSAAMADTADSKSESSNIKNSAMLFDTLCYYDTCAVIADSGRTVVINSDLVTTYIRVYNGCTLVINSGVTVTLIGDVHPENELILFSGGTITGQGLLKTHGNPDPVHDVIMEIRENSVFDVEVKSSSGRAVFLNGYNENFISAKKNITIDAGAQMLYSGSSGNSRLTLYGNILNNGKLWSSSGLINFKGQTITNNDSVYADIEIDTNCTINGAGAWLCTYLYVMPYRTLYLDNNINLSVRNFILQPNADVNLNTYSLTLRDYAFYNYTDVLMYDSTLISNGQIFTNGTGVRLNMDTTASLRVPLIADSGNILIMTLFGSRTIFDTTITINVNASFNSSNEVIFKDDVFNNGYLNLNFCKFRGSSLVNNGTVCSGIFDFDSDCNFSGSGYWTCSSYTYLKSNRTMTLQSNVNIRNNTFEIEPNAVLNLNGYNFNLDHLDSTSGNFIVDSAATITGDGEVVAKGYPQIFRVDIFNHYHSNFNSKLRVESGILYMSSSIASENNKTIINKSVRIDSGAILSTTSYSDTLIAKDSIINKGTMYGSFKLSGNTFINNGIVTSASIYFGSNFSSGVPQTLQGTGSFAEPSNCIITNGASVSLISNHQLFNLQIDSGGTFDISNQTLKISGLGTVSIVNNGTFITNGSTVEFNNQNNAQYFPVANINYNNVIVNNPQGVLMSGNVTLPALLTLSIGDIELNNFVITLTPSATLVETPGNTVKGNGYITTTRNINSPSGLNVGGLGAVITTSSNLGMTEIRRGHLVQYGLAGKNSIARYFDIEPTNNSNLNATLSFKYDESELDTLNESELGLYKSTNGGLNYSFIGGASDTANNQITLTGINDFSRWSASEYSFPMPASITLIIEGLLDEITFLLNSVDTVTILLANSTPPYNIIDSSRSTIDSINYTGEFLFSNAPSGVYYIIVKHRNGIETWSKSGGEIYNIGKNLIYDFTIAQTQAYGDNQISKAGRWCIYSGDVNQDGIIEGEDLLLIDNDAAGFLIGYSVSDLNGDGIVDGTDMLIAGNNSDNFIYVIKP